MAQAVQENDHTLHLYVKLNSPTPSHQPPSTVPLAPSILHMISLPTFDVSLCSIDRLYTENDNPLVSPKRSFAQLEEDPLSQLVPKRRDVQPSKRAPLDSLSSSDWENRRTRDTQSTNSAMHHTLVAPTSVPDLWALRPEHTVSSASCGMQRSSISDALVCSWPPPIPTAGTAVSSYSGLVGQQAPPPEYLHSPDEKNPSRVSFPDATSTAWDPSGSFTTEPTTTAMNKPTGWKSENVLQPIRSRTNSMPSIRRPPGELWRSDSGSTKVNRDAVASLVSPTPPGLSPLRGSSSSSNLVPHGSVSLSLALGSQPLRASDHTKAVSPIGAERSRVLSITSFTSHTRNSPATQSHDLSNSPWCFSPLSPAPQAKGNNGISMLNTTSRGNPRVAAGTPTSSTSKEDLHRLLRQAVRNKYAPKVTSPLSPLRTAHSALALSTDPEYRLRMPSPLNAPSPRYSNCPPRRTRTVCEAFQSLDWNTTCMHCQECKRDTIGKRLLAFRYRQQQMRHVQGSKLVAFRSRGAIVDDDRIVRANRIREVFAYEVDEEEKSLWEEVAAVTGMGPMTFSRSGASCAYRRVVVDANHDGVHADYLEHPDEGLLANESATLVSVY